MEPFSMVAFVLGAAVCGIIGNRTDAGFRKVISTFVDRLRHGGSAVNHDLQRAVRKAYLQATLAFCDAYLKIPGVKSGDVSWAEAVQKWIRDELNQLSSAKYIPPSNQAESQLELLLQQIGKAADQRIEDLRIALKKGLLSELEQHRGKPPARFEEMINEGWDNPALEKGKVRLDWFDLLCAFFAECVKTNESVRSILEGQLLSDLSIKVDEIENEFRKLGNEMVNKLEQVYALVASSRTEQAEGFAAIEGKLDEMVPGLVLLADIKEKQEVWARILVEAVKEEGEKTRRAGKEGEERILTFLDQRFMELQNASVVQRQSIEEMRSEFKEALRMKSERIDESLPEPIPIKFPRLHGQFVDREKERRILRDLLHQDNLPLVAIVGPGGYGKTELTSAILKETAPSGKIADQNVYGILYLPCFANDLSLGRIFSEAGLVVGKSEKFREIYARNDWNIERKIEFFLGELNKAGNVWLVMDKLDEMLTTEDEFTDPELRQFIEIIAATEHSIRLIFTSRAIPRFQGNQRMKRVYLDTGLPEAEAIEYLRTEGAEYGLADADNELLVDFGRRVQGIPKALECIIGYLSEKYPVIQLSDLMGDVKLFADFDSYDVEKGLKRLIAEQFTQQSSDAQLLLCGLSIFPKPVPLVALQSILPALDTTSILARLERNKLVNKQNNLYDLNPLVREYVYKQIPEKTEDRKGIVFTRSNLHSHAADFFAGIRLPAEHWKTISDLEPQLNEIHHRIRAEQYKEALRLINLIDFDYLRPWGYSRTAIGVHEQLKGKLVYEVLEASNFEMLGFEYMNIGRFREAVTYFEESLKIASNTEEKKEIIKKLAKLGMVYQLLGERSKANDCYKKATSMCWDIGDEEVELQVLESLGPSLHGDGENQLAIQCYEWAIEISNKVGDRHRKALLLGNIGDVYQSVGETTKALEYYEQALDIHRKTNDQLEEGNALSELGDVYNGLGNFQKAIELYEQALEIHRKTDNRVGEAFGLGKLGDVYKGLGNFQKAIELYEQALEIHRKTDNRAAEGIVLHELGTFYNALGNFQKAIQLYEEALKINHEIGALPDEKENLRNLGDAYLTLGKISKAFECYDEFNKICEKTSDFQGTAESWIRIGNVLSAVKKPEDAIKFYELALKILRELSDRGGEGTCLNNLGSAYAELGDRPKAIEFYEQSLQIYRDIGNRADEKRVLNNLGRAYEVLGETKKATEYYEGASKIQNETQGRQDE